jgi:orotate phosphoribosyltransferase-like protein
MFDERTKKIFDMRQRGMTFKQIGEEFKISRQRVHFIVSKINEKNVNKSVDNLETIS